MGNEVSLLTPYKMGKFHLSHRIVLGPLTRSRSYGNIPQPHAIVYYSQRASNGGLLINETTGVSDTAQGYDINQMEQHPYPAQTRRSKMSLPLKVILRLTVAQQERYLKLSMTLDLLQGMPLKLFMKESANDRTDEYGGDLENRCRFPLQLVEAVVNEIGGGRVGMRLTPFMDFMDCWELDPEALGLHMVQSLNKHGVLYCHMIEPRMSMDEARRQTPHGLQNMRQAFNGTFIASGGYDRDEGNKAVAEGYVDLVSYGRLFLANLDLPKRFRLKVQLNKYDRSTFYTSDPVVGYTDYPFLEDCNESMNEH
ncbi:hypothetical protein J5N97_017028 [Dioscorea zingiberensis]|uniref:NADH:flavin oxidoreductase/NADH oxidase N-terminal domain-containing protein n=1 Tax=Dioscorea zingiberensis TaxID=325984 RepID=A0A9D5HG72_9LILI|nr:hypothetical protein J5N97_017028 [Dioscorea zingiberensis]